MGRSLQPQGLADGQRQSVTGEGSEGERGRESEREGDLCRGVKMVRREERLSLR